MNARCTQQNPMASESENHARAPSSEQSNTHSVIQSLPPDRSTQQCSSMTSAPTGGTTPTTKREKRQSQDRPRKRYRLRSRRVICISKRCISLTFGNFSHCRIEKLLEIFVLLPEQLVLGDQSSVRTDILSGIIVRTDNT